MSLKPAQVQRLLAAKRSEFTAFSQETWQQLQDYRAVLYQLSSPYEATLRRKLATCYESVGARLLEPLELTKTGAIACGLTWQNKEESHAWVRDRLTGVRTFAVDGSQIYPGKDLSIPVALVQIGWFENWHLPTGVYEKDIEVDVMTPVDLKAGHSGEPVDRRVNMRRFEMETDRLVRYIKDHAQQPDCLVFFDGSLVATFAEAFDEESRRFYVRCLLRLLRASETHRVPVVGYIDTSYAQDLASLLRFLFALPESQSIHDAQVMNLSLAWGDRTPLMLCQRSGILETYQDQQHRIAFTYLKTSRDQYPARLELPLWVYEDDRLEQVLDWVRGEVIIGGGYPYAIETADQTAVLQAGDRQTFLRILQEWAEGEDLNLRFSRKMVSKVRRR